MSQAAATINPGLVRRLASIGCSQIEIAYVIDVAPSTLKLRLAEDEQTRAQYEAGRADRKTGPMGIVRMLWKSARQGNVTAMVWLTKNLFGWRDSVQLDISATAKRLNQMTDEELVELASGTIDADDGMLQ